MGERPKVLCTGGCGYVGSHTAVELLREGYDVTLLDVCPLSVPRMRGEVLARACHGPQTCIKFIESVNLWSALQISHQSHRASKSIVKTA